MNRILPKYHYDFLKNEFDILEENGKLQTGQAEELISYYEVQKIEILEKKKVNPMQILLVIGSILIGLSILSFVASNWSQLSNLTKYLMLFFMLIGFYVAGFKLEGKKKNLSRVFYYIGAFAYGAEIIYIGQMFHLGGNIETALMLWGIGILALAFHLKDFILKLIGLFPIYLSLHIQFMFADGNKAYIMAMIIPLLFLFGYYVMKRSLILLVVNFVVLYEFIQLHMVFHPLEMDRWPIELIVIVPALFYIGHRFMNKSLPLFIVNLMLGLETVAITLGYYRDYIEFVIGVCVFFLIGTILTYLQHRDYKMPMKIVGMALQFIAGVVLTFPSAWWELAGDYDYIIAIGFAILYTIYNLYYVKKESLFHVGVICVLVLRYYIDLSFAFMDKSIAFFIGGVLLIALGFWFEKTRKREAKKYEKA